MTSRIATATHHLCAHPDCEEFFRPKPCAPHQRFCSRRCAQQESNRRNPRIRINRYGEVRQPEEQPIGQRLDALNLRIMQAVKTDPFGEETKRMQRHFAAIVEELL